MSITPFTSIPITTSVFVQELPYTVNLPIAFALLPVHDDFSLIKPSRRRAGNSQAPSTVYFTPETPGIILEMKVGDLIRNVNSALPSSIENDEMSDEIGDEIADELDASEQGVAEIKKKKYGFPNCINIKMGVGEKILDLKVSPRSVQMTGVKTFNQSTIGFQLLDNHLKSIQQKINEAIAGESSALDFLCHRARVDVLSREAFVQWLYEDGRLIYDEIEGFLPPPVIVMINKNYSLGERVSLKKAALILEKFPGIKVLYNNCINHNVSVSIYDDTLDSLIKGNVEGNGAAGDGSDRKYVKKRVNHKFIINASGQITQSGRSPSRMESAYNVLMGIIRGNM
jgi:hypothetical protein